MIIIVCGLPGVGKTFFAKELAKRLGAVHISSDAIRMQVLDERTYSQDEKDRIYSIMAKRAEEEAGRGDVVLDATFYLKRYRGMMCKIGQCRIIECILDLEELVKRMEKRKGERSESEADFAIYEKVKGEFEPVKEDHLTIDTAAPMELNIGRAIEWMRIR